MKANSFFMAIAIALFSLITVSLSSCTYVDEPGSGMPINLEVLRPEFEELSLPREVFTASSPVKVIGFRQECQSYSQVFIDYAFIDEEGHLIFINGSHFWLNDRLMTFTVYWPADSEVEMDPYGRITGGNCIIVGHSIPMNPVLTRKDGSISSMENKIILRPFLDI